MKNMHLIAFGLSPICPSSRGVGQESTQMRAHAVDFVLLPSKETYPVVSNYETFHLIHLMPMYHEK